MLVSNTRSLAKTHNYIFVSFEFEFELFLVLDFKGLIEHILPMDVPSIYGRSQLFVN